MQDEFEDLDSLTELEDSRVFSFNQMPVKSYEKGTDVQVDITIEMDLDLRVISRSGYTINPMILIDLDLIWFKLIIKSVAL